ncbi:hypothetical protein GH714_017986 [Hevea brasiliensis]|uniref:Ribose-phosphate pyrophosphokinase N-terminal domain-containing protein n=1 Tax=Hevea brasiliensis TaxID=3981 RepID=A0A6A6M8F0_HEVBR|nr:hypothetical protein GH714_017986 [Hevea brasiliensis]
MPLVMNLIGDVKGKVAVIVDDMIDTAGTIAKGAALLHQEGAREVYACCTHAVFSPPAIERLSSGLFQEVIITNTIPVAEKNYFPQLTVLSVANLLGETIWRVHDDCSFSLDFVLSPSDLSMHSPYECSGGNCAKLGYFGPGLLWVHCA